MKKIISISFIIVIIDQLIKMVVASFELHHKITVIPNFFSITYVQNDGAAWSILSGNRLLLIVIGLLALGLIYFFLIRNKQPSNYEQISYGLLIGGITGNLIDRIVHGYVIDYLDFKIINYYFPVFNLADTIIIIAMALIIISIIKGESNEKDSSSGNRVQD